MALTFKQKIVTSLVVVGAVPALLLTGISVWRQMQEMVLSKEIAMQGVAHGKAAAVTDRMKFLLNQSETMGQSPYTREAYKAFNTATQAYLPSSTDIDMQSLQERYRYQAENTSGASLADVNRWMPSDDLAKGLQSLYIGTNPHPIGAKENLFDAGDGSVYSLYHNKYHGYFKDVLNKFGLYDIFLIEPKEGRIIYSVFKEVDYMMPLFTSTYADTNFALAIKRALNEGTTVIEDFELYEPSYGAAASFIASPIKENGQILGVYVAQIPAPTDLFPQNNAELDSFETYLMSADGFMRTNSERLEEDTVGKKIDTAVAAAAQTQAEGYLEAPNYHGDEALTGFSKTKLTDFGIDWIAVAEVEKADIMTSVYEMIGVMAIILAVIVAIVGLIGLVLAKTLLKPVEEISSNFNHSSTSLSSATQQIGGAMQSMIAATESARNSGNTVRESSSEASRNVAAVASAVEELNISINDISRSITESNTLIDQAVEQAQQTDAVIKKLGEAGTRISDVIQLINDLAEQTNLLALNAAIEAARAGDAGRGFAVVADEVKKLASHTSEATSDITDQVKNIQVVSDETMAALKSVMEAIHQIRDSSTTVSAAVEEQGSVTQEISASVQEAANRVDLVDQNMGNVDHANQETSTATDQVSAALAAMEGEFKEMNDNLTETLHKMGLKS